MKKLILTIVSLVLALLSVNAQQNNELFYAGYTYYEKVDGTQEMIPLATVKICDAENPESILAITLTGLNGYYDLRGIDVEKNYIIKVKTADLQEQEFKIYPNNGRVKKGNLSTNLALKVSADYTVKTNSQIFKIADFDQNLILEAMLKELPVLKVEEDEFFTKDDGTLKILFNGMVVKNDIYTKLKNYPIGQIVEQIEYFDLSNTPNTIFEGALNIRLKMGQHAVKPNYELKSLERVSE